MNRFFALFLFLLLSIQNVKAEAFLPFGGPRPLAVMLETDPWPMVIGSDTPSFVLYEDGQLISVIDTFLAPAPHPKYACGQDSKLE
jgi:hypothetical protein